MKSKGLPLMRLIKKEEKVRKGIDLTFKLPIDDVKGNIIIGDNGTYKYLSLIHI